MSRFISSVRKVLIFCAGLFLYIFVFINDAPAPPPPPLPPSVPAGGDIAYSITFAAIAAYGLFRLSKKKRD